MGEYTLRKPASGSRVYLEQDTGAGPAPGSPVSASGVEYPEKNVSKIPEQPQTLSISNSRLNRPGFIGDLVL